MMNTNIKIFTTSLRLSVIIFMFLGVYFVFGPQVEVHASPVVDFNPGRIIDDMVFTNASTMNPDQIQLFLNSKVPNCDTWGTQVSEFGGGTRAQWGTARGYPPPYTCLKDYSENGLSAAQIIYNVSQRYQINPQVLIVLLQKEQGLVTDTWPLSTQYKTATGYACGDTSSCNTKYYGLTAQLYWSGTMFHAIATNNPIWSNPYASGTIWYSQFIVGDNKIYYNPGPCTLYNDAGTCIARNPDACNSSTVNIQNRSTQALYSYTPYQPNQSALNAGYGTGDSCGAYGNRNFYLYFTDWFGSVRANDTPNPHPDGTLVNVDNAIYLIQSDSLHHIINQAVFESNNFRWGDVKPATSGDRKLAISWSFDFIQPGRLYTGTNTGVYVNVYENGQWVKQLISYASFVSLGYSWDQLRHIDNSQLPQKDSTTILTTSLHPEGTLIKNSQGVFLIDHGTKRYISAVVFGSNGWMWSDIVQETTSDSLLPRGADMLLRQGTIISDGSNLYVIKLPTAGPEIKRPIGPWSCYYDIFKYNLNDINLMSPASAPKDTGALVTC